MKNKKIFLYIIIFISLFVFSTISLATDYNETVISENIGTETPSENNEQGNNENINNTTENTESESNENVDSNATEQVETNSDNNGTSTYEQPITYTSTQANYQEDDIKSDNANLKKLSTNIDGLSPEFNKNITDYYLIVDLSIDEIEVNAIAEDSKASVSVYGDSDLKQGENTIDITVKAEDGTTKTYTIHVTKTDDIDGTNANLKILSIKGFSIYPTFKSSIYSYNIIINEKISNLEIVAEPENAEAKCEIVGNENLIEGNNLIKIIVTAQNGETTKEYRLNAYITSGTVKGLQTNKKQAIVILSILALGIVTVTVIMAKNQN